MIQKDDPIWVRFKNRSWTLKKFDSFVDGKVKTLTVYRSTIWDEYSILNPDPDSLEAKSIELLGKLHDFGFNTQIDAEIRSFRNKIKNL